MRFIPQINRRSFFITIVFVLLVGALGYYFMQYRQLSLAQTPKKENTDKTADIIRDIKALIYISSDSGAQVAEITDVTKLSGQPFFMNAQNHDYLALFPSARKAVLYRPSDKKIIEVGPFSPDTASTTQKAATTTQKTNPFSPSH